MALRASILAPFAVAALTAAALAAACVDTSAPSTRAARVAPAPAGSSVALPALEPTPPRALAPEARRDVASSPVVFDPIRGGVWTANGDVGTVSYVDIDTRKVVEEIAIGADVTSVALSPDAKWIAAVDRGSATVTLVDAESRAVRRTLSVGTHPRAAVWDATDPRWLYVSIEDDGSVAIVDRTRGVVDHTISVGRSPAGLAVSRRRRELVVLHRADARVTIASLEGVYTPADQRAPNVEVPLDDEAAGTSDLVPHGKPFAFESIAWTPNGDVAWLPHELLAPTHPFQFQRTVFPSVSVVDLSARKEVTTDPAADAFAGRKNLFAAINIPDSLGNTSVVSQPCAAAMHPNGLLGYVVACGSEDLLVFGTDQGIAVDLLRDLPGDHPIGIALDDTGQRAFVLSDQSHTLATIDLADGNPVWHAQPYGAPIALASHDPLDPELREGMKLFFRASSSKGALATTGNNWLSCGACHLDGFGSSNAGLLAALRPASAKSDARVGHGGLVDLFSTSSRPDDAEFNPHDLLVAVIEQGGLAPDRTGADRHGAIDPSAPTAEALTMARRLARVVTRYQPIGPSWIAFPPNDPPPTRDGAWCGRCHVAEFAQWSKGAHAHAADDPMVLYGVAVEVAARGPSYARVCAGCHDPTSTRLGDTSFVARRGVTCVGCHDVEAAIAAGGNGDLATRTHDWTQDHKAWGTASLERLRKPEFCAGCHDEFVPGVGLRLMSTLAEYESSPLAATKRCVDCHMSTTGGVADHRIPGGNVYVGARWGDDAMVADERKQLTTALKLHAERVADGVDVVASVDALAHGFPGGVSDIREAWVEVQAVDGVGHMVASWGGPIADGTVPMSAARLGVDLGLGDGAIALHHELSEVTHVPYSGRILPTAPRTFHVVVPSALPVGAIAFDAVVKMRALRTTYFRFATGVPSAIAPETEMARTRVP